jgi:hypothetical protein
LSRLSTTRTTNHPHPVTIHRSPSTARAAFPAQAADLERIVDGSSPDQLARARQISQAITSYVRDYSEPLLHTARRDPASVRTVAATAEASGGSMRSGTSSTGW